MTTTPNIFHREAGGIYVTPLPSPKFYLAPEQEAAELYSDIDRAGGENGDSGTDLRFAEDVTIPPTATMGGMAVIVGLKVHASLHSYNFMKQCVELAAYQIVPRSSIAKTPLGLANSVGTIDAGYTGELKVAIRNYSSEPYIIKRGTALFQLVTGDLTPATVKILTGAPGHADTKRGAGGFGSTGIAGSGGAKK